MSLLFFVVLFILVSIQSSIADTSSYMLDNIRSCDLDSGKACDTVGNMYFYGNGVIVNYSTAISYYNKSCNLHYDVACMKLGNLYFDGKIVIQDYNKAVIYYIKSCEYRNGLACKKLGDMYFDGYAVSQDYSKAVIYYTKSCEYQSLSCQNTLKTYSNNGDDSKKCKIQYGEACSKLGELYYKGQGVIQDYSKSIEYYNKGCLLLGFGGACEKLGKMYYKGQGVLQDYSMAVKYYDIGCRLQNGASCIAFAELYELGQGVEQNDAKAAYYFAKGSALMPSEELQKFFNELLIKNRDKSTKVKELQQIQSQIESLRTLYLTNESDYNILQIQDQDNDNTNYNGVYGSYSNLLLCRYPLCLLNWPILFSYPCYPILW